MDGMGGGGWRMLWSAYCSQLGLFVCTAYKLHALTNWRSKRSDQYNGEEGLDRET